MLGLFNPFRWLQFFASLIGALAIAFGVYSALDEDLRTLVWYKWTSVVAYEWPGGDRNINLKVEVDGKEKEFQIPAPAPR